MRTAPLLPMWLSTDTWKDLVAPRRVHSDETPWERGLGPGRMHDGHRRTMVQGRKMSDVSALGGSEKSTCKLYCP